MDNLSNSFKTYIPLQLYKGVDENTGEEKMRMRGLMSTTSIDDDGQVLDPSGFDMSEFMNNGFMNWHHQTNKSPMSIIGKPTKYEHIPSTNEMWIDFELFSKNPLAREVYELQSVLEEEGLGLGLSLEGVATKFKDPSKRYVEKARITGCAVTPAPKNKDAIVSLVKGHSSDFTLLNEEFVQEMKQDKDTTLLSKGDVVEIVGSKFPRLSYNSLEKIFNFTLKLQKGKGMNKQSEKVSDSTLEKALKDLGLSNEVDKGESVNDTDKSNKTDALEERMDRLEKGILQIAQFLEKGQKTTKDLEDKDEDGGNEDKLNKSCDKSKPSEMKKGEDEDGGDSDEDDDEEGEDPSKMEKGNVDSVLVKAITNKLTTLIKGIESQNETICTLKEELQKSNQMIDFLAKEPMPRKSITTKSYLKKGGHSDVEDKFNVLSVSRDKREILNILEKGAVEGGQIINKGLAESLVQFETGNIVTNTLKKALKEEGYTLTN